MQKTKIQKLKEFLFNNKKKAIGAVILVLVGFFFLGNGESVEISVVDPNSGVFKKTVSATGVVTSKTDIDLSFSKQGTISSIKVNVGDKVKEGQILASLDAKGEYAKVTEARGSLALAEAKLAKTLAGSSDEEVNLARVTLDNAKRDLENTKQTQGTLVENAYNKLLNSSFEALPYESSGSTITAPTVSGTYILNKEGNIDVRVYSTGSGLAYSVSGLVAGDGYVNTTTAQPLGNSGLYILFSSTTNLSGTSWRISVPNQKGSDYLTNLNAYQSALKTKNSTISSAESLVAQREAELALKLASARDADVALAQAEVLSARGRLEEAQANYEKNLLRAPAGGTITRVDIKLGGVANASERAIVLQDVENLYIETPINESNIASVTLGQSVDITLDALGSTTKFTGLISHIDPSSETEEGVVNYKIKVSINEKDPNVRPGMNAEIVITVFSKDGVLSVPRAALFEKDGKNFVNILTNEKKKRYEAREVTLGLNGDGNTVEILSGVVASDKLAIVTPK